MRKWPPGAGAGEARVAEAQQTRVAVIIAGGVQGAATRDQRSRLGTQPHHTIGYLYAGVVVRAYPRISTRADEGIYITQRRRHRRYQTRLG